MTHIPPISCTPVTSSYGRTHLTVCGEIPSLLKTSSGFPQECFVCPVLFNYFMEEVIEDASGGPQNLGVEMKNGGAL